MNALGGAIFDTRIHNKKILRELRNVIKNTSKIGLYQCYFSSDTKDYRKIETMNNININVFGYEITRTISS